MQDADHTISHTILKHFLPLGAISRTISIALVRAPALEQEMRTNYKTNYRPAATYMI